jgi:protein kinase/serine/threonine-protein kinase
MTPTRGRRFVLADRYHIQELVGEGGFAKVYRAIDTETDREVAVKVPNYEDSNNDSDVIDKYFRREAETLERIQSAGGHPNVMTLHARGSENSTAYIVVGYIDGYDLDEAIEQTGPLGEDLVEQVRQVGIALCDAMSFLHESEIVYRDLKPDNVMLTEENGRPKPVLIDFNTATGFETADDSDDARTTILGPYKAPEIVDPEGSPARQGPWSDVYSIGKILLFLLKGTVPRKDGVSPRELGVDCDPYLSAVVEKATRTNYERRFRNATSMKRILEAREARPPPRATIRHLQTGEAYTIEPGDTVGRAETTGPTPSVAISDEEGFVSTVQVEFDVDGGGTSPGSGHDWMLRDHSLNGTYVRSDGSWQRVLSETGRERLREEGEDPTGPDGEVPPTECDLSPGDLVALVHPSYGVTFEFGA